MKNELNKFIDTTFKNFIGGMKKLNGSFGKAGSQPRIFFLEYGFKESINELQLYFKTALKDYEYSSKENFLYLFNKLGSATEALSRIYSSI